MPFPALPVRKKIGILILAYNAASTLIHLLEKFPPDIINLVDEIFVFDDASSDETFALIQAYKKRTKFEKLNVFKNARNLGYGGNQKVGFTYALAHGFDYVVLMHGDGQHDPRVLPSLLDPILKGRVEVVFGSRMLKPLAALRGGMPLYKFVGNKVLTMYENFMVGTRMSEYHSGYRIYSCRVLAQVPFQFNTDDFYFDSQMIIQLHQLGIPILEVPVPTIYANEICRVNGIKYCFHIIHLVLAYRLHRAGVIHLRQYEIPPPV